MGNRFHFNPETGVSGPCRADRGGCPFLAEENHYDTIEEAARAYEQTKDTFENAGLSKRRRMVLTVAPEREEDRAKLEAEQALLDRKSAAHEPLTREELAHHERVVGDILNTLEWEGKTTKEIYTSRDLFGSRAYVPSRVKEQQAVIDHFMEKYQAVPCEGKGIVSGGLGGAGKTTVLAQHAGIDLSQFATVNPDDVKEEMANRGMIPMVAGLTPMDASPLAHAEASEISKEITARLCAARKNLIMDITMGDTWTVEEKITPLKNNGYESLEAVFVSIDLATSKARGSYRYQAGLNHLVTTGKGNGGRYLPAHVIDTQDPSSSAFLSKNEEVLIELDRRKMFTSAPRVFDNNVDGRAPLELSYVDFMRGRGRETPHREEPLPALAW